MTADQQRPPSSSHVEAVVRQYLQQRANGEAVDHQQLLAAHAALMPELERELSKARLIADARQKASAAAEGDANQQPGAGLEGASLETGMLSRETTATTGGDQRAASDSHPFAPEVLPRLFGERYRLVRKLGQGGMGQVYLADDLVLERQVAFKIPRLDGRNRQDLLRRFQREARSVAALRHPAICPVYDVSEVDGIPYLTMPFIDGEPLSTLIAQGWPTEPSEAAQMISQLAAALHVAHGQGVIHRDLKPANVIVDWDGNPVVMDFGLALRTRSDESRVTQEGTILGTPAYMAPEQVSGDPDTVDATADIYALGVMLYEMLTGQLPFNGSVASVIHQIINSEPQPPSAQNPRVDPELQRICLRLMAKQVQDRYADLGEVLRDLAAYLTGQPGPEDSQPRGPQIDDAPQISARGDSTDRSEREMAAASASDAVATDSPAADGAASATADSMALVSASTSASISAAGPAAAEPAAAGQEGSSLAPAPSANVRWRGRRAASAIAIGLLSVLLAWGAITLLVKQREGTVKLEIPEALANSPNFAVLVDGDQVDITGLPKPLRLTPGTHSVRVRYGDVESESRTFAIQAGENEPVRITWLDGELAIDQGEQPAATRHASRAARSAPQLQPSPLSPPQPAPVRPVAPVADGPTAEPLRKFPVQTAAWAGPKQIVGVRPLAGNQARLDLLDVANGRVIRSTSSVGDWLWCCAVSPDGAWMAAAGNGGPVYLWDVQNGTHVALSGHNRHGVVALQFSSDSRRLISGDFRETIRIWNPAEQQEVHRIRTAVTWFSKELTNPVSFSTDGTLAAAAAKESVFVYNVADGSTLHELQGHTENVISAAISHGNEHLASGGQEKVVRLWDLSSGRETGQLNVDGPVTSMAWSPDGRLLIVGDGAKLRIFDVQRRASIQEMPVPEKSPDKTWVTSIAVSPDGRHFLTSGPATSTALWAMPTASNPAADE